MNKYLQKMMFDANILVKYLIRTSFHCLMVKSGLSINGEIPKTISVYITRSILLFKIFYGIHFKLANLELWVLRLDSNLFACF